MKYMLRSGCRQVHVFMGGVGSGGACSNVHVNLQMKDMLRCGCRQVHVFMDNNVHGSFFNWVMLRYSMFS